jgi:hypothetical protein
MTVNTVHFHAGFLFETVIVGLRSVTDLGRILHTNQSNQVNFSGSESVFSREEAYPASTRTRGLPSLR